MKHINALTTSAVAFGRFDGMHIGHQAVIEKLCAIEGQTPVLVSFSEEVDPIIYSESEKEYLLKDSGVELMISMPAKEAEAMDAEAFARDVLVAKLNAKTVVLGEGYKDLAAYKALGEKLGFAVVTVPTVTLDGEEVSTCAIKKAIEANDVEKMLALLGRTYIMQGIVVHGKAQGRKFGMPTANLGVAKNKLFPPYGVYATLTHMEQVFRGMTNIGLRPSDDDIPIATIETFLLNFEGDIYDKPLTLEVFKYIRGTKKFPGGLAELRKQIDKDIEDCRVFLDDILAKAKE